jgi:hypothetical protein
MADADNPVTSIDWTEVALQLHSLVDTLAAAHATSGQKLLEPDAQVSAEGCYMAAFRLLYGDVERTITDLQQLSDRVDRAVPPVPSLETALEEIEAEGHVDISLDRYQHPRGIYWRVRTRTDSVPWPGPEASREERAAWRQKVEDGDAEGPTALAAAEARLTDIRELRVAERDRGVVRTEEQRRIDRASEEGQ